MNSISNQEADRLLEDIASIKQVINRNKPVLKRLFNLAPFRWFLLTVSLVIIGFSLLILLLVQNFGSYSSIPGTVKIIYFVAMAVFAVILQVWKGGAYLASAKRINRNFTLGWAFKEFYSSSISQIYILFVGLMIFFTVFFIIKNSPYFIIPVFSICVALISICYGVILQFRYGLIVGYWFLLTGICTIVFNSIPAPVAIIMTMGCGMLLFTYWAFKVSGSKD